MIKWRPYPDMESLQGLKFNGNEFVGREISITEKRDGANVAVWFDPDSQMVIVSSHHNSSADLRVQGTMRQLPIWKNLEKCVIENPNLVLYGELMVVGKTPTQVEPANKEASWMMFDVYDYIGERFVDWKTARLIGDKYLIPMVQELSCFIPSDIQFLLEARDYRLKWCKENNREGIVIKCYETQLFAKEKNFIPKPLKEPKKLKEKLPEMPEETIQRALQHAYEEVGAENWNDKSKAMPIVAKHFELEAREHTYEPPRDFYGLYQKFDTVK